MIERTIDINISLDPSAVALLVQTATTFKSLITFTQADKGANAKSLMGIISLGLCAGQTVTITADGEDEVQALSAVDAFLRAK